MFSIVSVTAKRAVSGSRLAARIAFQSRERPRDSSGPAGGSLHAAYAGGRPVGASIPAQYSQGVESLVPGFVNLRFAGILAAGRNPAGRTSD
jgi:hypothetical protein